MTLTIRTGRSIESMDCGPLAVKAQVEGACAQVCEFWNFLA